ncbi:MAG: cytochrome b [Pseudomonadota bacterium]|jgi:cytochrome b561|nr:cytochrome b [Pseudomonadota bacterium]
MHMRPMPEGYSPAQKALHWATALLIVTTVPIALTMTRLGPGSVTDTLYELHKSFGLLIFGLALGRVTLRLMRGAPPLVPGLPSWQRAAAHGSHIALYILIVLVPVLGWAGTSACCAPVNLFWTVPLTLPVPGGMETAERIFALHKAMALTLAGIVVIHVAAALYHHLIRRDDTLRRMLPLGRVRNRAGAAKTLA